MKLKLMICAVISLFIIQAHASQERGGGNLINGKVIEEYLVNPHDLPFFDTSLENFLSTIRYVLPTFSDDIDQTIEGRNWYLLPIKLTELPYEITGLNFSSDQVAFQNTSEIFFDHNLMNTMNEKSLGLLYRHEVFMATLSLSPVNTRTLMAYSAKAPIFSVTEFREKVAQLSGRVYLTSLEIKMVDSIVVQIETDMMKICDRYSEDSVVNNELEKFFAYNFSRDSGWYKDTKQKALGLLAAEYVDDSSEIYSKSMRDNISARLNAIVPGINLAHFIYRPHTPFVNFCKSYTN